MIYTVYTTSCVPEGGSLSFATGNKERAIKYAQEWWEQKLSDFKERHERNKKRWPDLIDDDEISLENFTDFHGVLVLEWPDDQEYTFDYEKENDMYKEVYKLGFGWD